MRNNEAVKYSWFQTHSELTPMHVEHGGHKSLPIGDTPPSCHCASKCQGTGRKGASMRIVGRKILKIAVVLADVVAAYCWQITNLSTEKPHGSDGVRGSPQCIQIMKLENTDTLVSPFCSSVWYLAVKSDWPKQWNETAVGEEMITCWLARRHRTVLRKCFNFLICNPSFSSLMNYSALVWATTTKENIWKLLLLQKLTLRIAFKVPYFAHTRELFMSNNVIRIDNLYRYKRSCSFKAELNRKDMPIKKDSESNRNHLLL